MTTPLTPIITLDELIATLQAARAEHGGDVPVLVFDDEKSRFTEVYRVEARSAGFDDESNGWFDGMPNAQNVLVIH